jgi:hypothetical protein
MDSTTVALISLAGIFTATLVGMRIQKLLPAQHLSKESQESVKLGSGMIATLTALVLGLLVSSAKSTFDTVSNGVVQQGAFIIHFDRVLAHYGPEAKELRVELRRTVEDAIGRIWSEEQTGSSGLKAMEGGSGAEAIQDKLRALTPTTEAQKELLTQAKQLAADFSRARWLLVEQAQNPLPTVFLFILVAWLTMLFMSFGLLAPFNWTVVTVMFLGALSVTASIFLVLEMSRPFDGFIKVSSAPLHKALELLGR